jgi:short-chain Z-isoprenyl diphosphate synthase
VAWRDVLYAAYSNRLRKKLDPQRIPQHVGVILDGNRRWASLQGSTSETGHRVGAGRIAEFLGWCEQAKVKVVTLWLLSTDNLHRDPAELAAPLGIIDDTVHDLAEAGRWRINPVGALDLLPHDFAASMKAVEEQTRDQPGLTVNVAVAYGGRREVVDAVRSMLAEQAEQGTSLDDLAQVLDVEHIADHLYTKGQPDPDLVIRTSGEQRLSGFLLWQSAHSEFYFCEALWPDLREVDFLRALRAYAQRQRRFGE